jgi:membrane-bound lytic murein transglycosylase B
VRFASVIMAGLTTFAKVTVVKKACATSLAVTSAAAITLTGVAQPFRAASAAGQTTTATTTTTTTTADTRPSFSEWLAGVRTEALSRGIRQDIVDEALSNIDEPLPVVLERDRAQAETVFSLETYISRRLTPSFMKLAREKYASQRALLAEVGDRYTVPPRIVAAIWGVESNFGRFSGVRPTIAALATLAWDPRRATFFRGELFQALEILNRGDIEPSRMRGSWAGAMGQPQFMPSSYLQFAEDYDGDGRRDIWSTPGDVFASIANYLKGRGWKAEETWGRRVKVTPEVARKIVSTVDRRTGTCQATRNMTAMLPAARWQALGVRLMNGKALPKDMRDAALVSGTKQHYLVFSSYDAILDYNCSHSYAITVGLLADRIESAPAPTRSAKPKPGRPTRRAARARSSR